MVVTSSDPALVSPVWERFVPNTVLAWGEPFSSPLWEGRDSPGEAGLAFVCVGYSCSLPVRTPDELAELLDGKAAGAQPP